MPVRRPRRSQRCLLVVVPALLLASGLAACGGSVDDEPPPAATETAPQTAVPAAEPPPASSVPPAEPPPPPTPPPDIPVLESPAISASEPAPAPGEPSPPAAEIPAPEPAPRSFRYDTYDLSGAVAEPGHYAFLADPDDPSSAVTTYEELRDGTATALRIHTHDAHGVSQAAFYDDVETGDLVEWRQADDCFVRYQVTAVSEPAADAVARTIGVAWMTYAFTGCSGPIAGDTAALFEWGDLPDLGGASLTAPILHGPFQIVPENWTGERVPWTRHDPPAHNRDNERYTTDPAVARTYPYWREPALPDHWVLWSAATDSDDLPYGYRATWGPEPWDGFGTVEILAGFMWGRRGAREAHVTDPNVIPSVSETRVIAGRPARINYALPIDRDFDVVYLTIYDPATEAGYRIGTSHIDFRGANLDALIDLARSLFESPTRVLSYDTLDPAGGVGEPGHYAFLADPADPSSAVTTYEGLRDGTATALRIHAHDAHGVPQADLYDAVEVGDLVEWRQADDCFVRYQVTAVPEPAADAVTRELGVAWMTYAFTGCSGPIAGDTAATFEWGELPNLGGTSLTTPVRHGGTQLIPEGWTGATEAVVFLPLTYPPEVFTRDITVARQLPHWRDPVLPDGWSFISASAHGDSSAGYVAKWTGTGRGIGLRIYRNPSWVLGWELPAVARPNRPALTVRETRIIAGRPAWVSYGVPTSTPDPWFDFFSTTVEVYDRETGSTYTLHGLNRIYAGHNIDALIAVAASLFEDEGTP